MDRDANTYDHARAGCVYADAASNEVVGAFYGMVVIADAVLESLTVRGNAISGAALLVGETLTAGSYDPVQIQRIRVASGLIKLLLEPPGPLGLAVINHPSGAA